MSITIDEQVHKVRTVVPEPDDATMLLGMFRATKLLEELPSWTL